MKKWVIISFIVVAVGGGSGWFIYSKSQANQALNVMATAQTITAQKGKLEVAVTGSGSVTANTDEDVTAANTILVVDSVSVSSGESVDKGDTLVTFKNGDVVTAPKDGEITKVYVSSSSGASQGKVLMRMEDEDGVTLPITREDGDSSSNNSSTGGGSSLVADTVFVKEGSVVKTGDTLVKFTDGSILQAPVAGTITSLAVNSGDSVQSSATLAHITNYSSLETTISVDELDITKVKVGQSVKITASAFEGQTFDGIVTKVANEGTSTNGVSTFDVTVKIKNPKGLKIGMSTEASILIQSKADTLYVPVEAVYKNGNEKYVLVASSTNDAGESTKKVTVKTGISNDTNVEITSGLSEGESIEIPSVQSRGNSGGFMMQGGNFPGGGFQGGGSFGGRTTERIQTGGGQGGK
ncbi:efflux RND transporter periplasmic adaptor subunit [Gottfriedia acidiceleris]|uniref:Efflux RND transporter periplasmic adaptor subunit n=1 Tax=Gottfriedia acidiceleris TaxID=371036 RepID=A0ABY4JJJ6_9BACI|nr:efflux RND transporter periplasmic adaptor subunit [Gottfriedia acidiceleris]UPM53647.1 efflux RND transporter periplasmic adaptor subunit [Gottfriedia acidiceleris]